MFPATVFCLFLYVCNIWLHFPPGTYVGSMVTPEREREREGERSERKREREMGEGEKGGEGRERERGR